MKPIFRYCIVGTGFSGTCALWHFVKTITDVQFDFSHVEIEIYTVEQLSTNGPGYPYGMTNTHQAHLCNVQAYTMAIFGNDFVEWMRKNRDRITTQYPNLILESHSNIDLSKWEPDEKAFYPRALFGLYLSERFVEICNSAKSKGIRVFNYLSSEAIDGYADHDKFTLILRHVATQNLTTLGNLDQVLLTTGHWKSPLQEHLGNSLNFFQSPYPPEQILTKLSVINQPRGEKFVIYVQGMGPSAIDAIMTIYDYIQTLTQFHQDSSKIPFKIIVGSRCGFFPGVRSEPLNLSFKFLTEDHFESLKQSHHRKIPLSEIINLVDSELKQASGGTFGWNDIQKPKYSTAEDKLIDDLKESKLSHLSYTISLKARRMRFYQYLTAQDKELYDKDFDSHFIRTAVPMPVCNGKKILHLIQLGLLDTIKLGYGNVSIRSEKDGSFLLEYGSAEAPSTIMRVHYIIRAIGQNFDISKHPSSLIQNLLKRGEIVAFKDGNYLPGGIAIDPERGYRVLKKQGVLSYSRNLSSFGPLVQYWQHDNNFSAAFVRAAEIVAAEWASLI